MEAIVAEGLPKSVSLPAPRIQAWLVFDESSEKEWEGDHFLCTYPRFKLFRCSWCYSYGDIRDG
jgi:hypothetical protein